MSKLYSFTVKDLDGNDVSLEQYKGQVLLLVNTASDCGFAKQNRGLEKLQSKYADRGFTVLAFPSNDFDQEPLSENELKEYFRDEKVSFPVFAKTGVLSDQRSDLFEYLVNEEAVEWLDTPENHKSYAFQKEFHNGYWGKEITWNYNKFLFDQAGKLVGRYASFVEPSELDERILSLLENDSGNATPEKLEEDGVIHENQERFEDEKDSSLEPPIVVPPLGHDPGNPGNPMNPHGTF